MLSLNSIHPRIVTPSDLETTTTTPSSTSGPYQHIKRELVTESDLEGSSARVSKRVKMNRDTEYLTEMEIPEKRRNDPTPRISLLVETSPDRENTSRDIQSPTTYRALPALLEKTDSSSISLVPLRPSVNIVEEFSEPQRHSATPPSVQSALQKSGFEVMDKAACCRRAYQETKKKYKLLKLQLLEEKRIWKEEEDKREAEEMGKLVEEQKRLSKLMERGERRLAKLRKRSLRGTRSTNVEARDLNVEMKRDESGALESTENSVSSNQTQLHPQKRQQPSQGERSPRSPTHPFHPSSSSRTMPSLPLFAPPDTSSSNEQRIHEQNPQETTVPRQTQARSVSFHDSGVSAGPRRSNLSAAPSVPPVAAPEQVSQTGNANAQIRPSLTQHSPLNLNSNDRLNDPVGTPRKNKEKGQHAVGMSLQPKLSSDIPIALPKSDQELVQIGKLTNRHERHQRAPHVFGSQGRILAAYYRLGDIVDAAGASVWTEQELRRLFPGLGRAIPGCERELWYRSIYRGV